ncbi:hypothetical protein BFP72_17865 [Reichenbachiella sp. 5M10]|uniref:glycosyltransferase family 4 protein n=1 Tax=Reichenbachiella sp. 5M10 TaxID=1889772 RepID=UPI000C146A68|nr:glycosyltransferase family 1 protein [Reichenbachiella sp. 5M10]PIB37139.1 hypothetical protein BFP72_17865 [Reichenbachiella sp. 5M10]
MIVVNARFLTQQITGVQRFAIEICKELVQIDNDIKFVCPRGVIHKEIFSLFQCKVIGINTGYLWEQIDLPVFLKKNKSPLLLNFCNVAPVFYKNKIAIIHDLAAFANPKWFSWKFVMSYKIMIPLISKTSKKIGTVSEFSRKEIVKYLKVKSDKIFVVPNAVSFEFCSQSSDDKKVVSDNYFLTVGSLDPRKNFNRLIYAFGKFKYDNIKLKIVGSPNKVFKDNNVRAYITSDPRIELTGYLTDNELANLYKSAKLFIYPSLYEGFGIPPLEAMSFGCPTLVSDIGSLREVCSEASAYFNPYDEKDLLDKMELCLSNREIRTSLTEKGRERINNYSWQSSAILMNKIMKSLI